MGKGKPRLSYVSSAKFLSFLLSTHFFFIHSINENNLAASYHLEKTAMMRLFDYKFSRNSISYAIWSNSHHAFGKKTSGTWKLLITFLFF